MVRPLTDEERADWEAENKATRASRKRGAATAPAPIPPAPPAKRASVARQEAPLPPSPKRPVPAAAPALELLDLRHAERRFKPHPRIEAKLDLHGMTQEQAHDALFGFIARCHGAGKRHVVVITGKGTGVLKRAVPRWLELPALRRHVSAMAHARPEKGGEGVLHVLLKKPS